MILVSNQVLLVLTLDFGPGLDDKLNWNLIETIGYLYFTMRTKINESDQELDLGIAQEIISYSGHRDRMEWCPRTSQRQHAKINTMGDGSS